MYKRTNFLKCLSFNLFFFILGFTSISSAGGDCSDCNTPPTSPGNACRCNIAPTISVTYSPNMDTIDSANPVTLSASGGCPPYTWTVSSNYHLSNNETQNDNDQITLTATPGSCTSSNIVCTVTVTDSCSNDPKSFTINIRNAAGHWSGFGTICYGGTAYGGGASPMIGVSPDNIHRYQITANLGPCSDIFNPSLDCNDSCAASVLANLANYGFPNSKGGTIFCTDGSQPSMCSNKAPGKVGVRPEGSSDTWYTNHAMLEISTWVCP
jgi:hypothetical protein